MWLAQTTPLNTSIDLASPFNAVANNILGYIGQITPAVLAVLGVIFAIYAGKSIFDRMTR